MSRSRSWLVLATCLWVSSAVAAPALPARAKISLWPEFDKPAVLVIIDAWTPEGVPGELALAMPAARGEPTAVAARGKDGGLLNTRHTRQIFGEVAQLLVQAPNGHARIEYYAPLKTTGAHREFVYRWPGKAPAGGVEFEVQQPKGATDMKITPAPTASTSDGRGLTVHRGGFPGFETPVVRVTYEKPDGRLTREALPAPPPAPAAPAVETAQAATSTTAQGASPWYVVVITIFCLLFLGLAFRRWVQPRAAPKTPREED